MSKKKNSKKRNNSAKRKKVMEKYMPENHEKTAENSEKKVQNNKTKENKQPKSETKPKAKQEKHLKDKTKQESKVKEKIDNKKEIKPELQKEDVNKSEEQPKKKIKRDNSAIYTLLFIIFFVLFIISLVKIIIYISNTITNKKLINEINQSIKIEEKKDDGNSVNDKKYDIDFDVLKLINSDIVGYIDVNGTDVGYTVVKTDNNTYYLNHNFEKNYSDLGWIFADYRNHFDYKDKNIIIYGHNMKNGTMFASLKNILQDEWFQNKENRFVTFVNEDKEINYEVFSVYQTGYDEEYIQTDFRENQFKKFADKMKSRSKYDFGIELKEDDRMITLSTCGATSSTRIVLHAREIKGEKK